MHDENRWYDDDQWRPPFAPSPNTIIEIDQWGKLTIKVVYPGGRTSTVALWVGQYELKHTLGPGGYVEITLLRCEEWPLVSYVRVYNHDGRIRVG